MNAPLLPAPSADLLARTTDRLAAWATISSPSGDRDGLARMAAQLATDFAAVGLATTVVELGDGSRPLPVVLAHGPALGDPQTAGPALLLVGHLDTVLAAAAPQRDGDRLRATGAIDMKGGLAAFWGALSWLAEHRRAPPPDTLLVVVPDEEVGGEISHRAMRHWGAAARAVLVLEPGQAEPTGDGVARETVVIGRRGLFTWQLDVRGRSAHAGSAFWQGRSASVAAADWVLRAHRLATPGDGPTVNTARIVAGEAGLVADLASQAGIVGGLRQLNVVADAARVEGEARFLRAEQGVELRRRLRELAAAVAAEHEVTTELAITSEIPPLDPAGAAATLARQAEALAVARGWQLRAETDRGGISFPNMLPDPTAVAVLDGLGPCGGGMHTREEWIDLGSLARRVALVGDLLLALDVGVGAGQGT